MTVHIALANPAAAILASDSQGSDDRSETHGFQKQFAGPDFLVGVAGMGLVLSELFSCLQEEVAKPAPDQLTSAGIVAFVEQFVAEQIQPSARSQVQFVIVTPPGPEDTAVRVFRPGPFTHIGRPASRGFIGSGAEFVYRATSRYGQLGIVIPRNELADLVIAVEDYARAADESLTVDDSFMLGIVTNGRSYLMGDRRISLRYAPDPLQLNWALAATRFQNIMAAARAVNGEMVSVQQELSAIRTASLTQANLDTIQASNDGAITAGRQALIQQLQAFFVWYDGLLGRP